MSQKCKSTSLSAIQVKKMQNS